MESPLSVYCLETEEATPVTLCLTRDVALATQTIRALARVLGVGYTDTTVTPQRAVTAQELKASPSAAESQQRLLQIPDPPPGSRLQKSGEAVRISAPAKYDPKYRPSWLPLPMVVGGLAAGYFLGPLAGVAWVILCILAASRIPQVQDSLELRPDGLYLRQHLGAAPQLTRVPPCQAQNPEIEAWGGEAYGLRLLQGDIPFEVPIGLTKAEADWFAQALQSPQG